MSNDRQKTVVRKEKVKCMPTASLIFRFLLTFLFTYFLPCCTARGILVLQPGIEPGSTAVKAQTLATGLQDSLFLSGFRCFDMWGSIELGRAAPSRVSQILQRVKNALKSVPLDTNSSPKGHTANHLWVGLSLSKSPSHCPLTQGPVADS